MRRNAGTTKVRASAASRFPIHFLSRPLSIAFLLTHHLSIQAGASTVTPSLLRKVRASAALRTPITNSCTASHIHRIIKRNHKAKQGPRTHSRSRSNKSYPGPTAGAGAAESSQENRAKRSKDPGSTAGAGAVTVNQQQQHKKQEQEQ